jgi:hypothetical protein
MLYRVLGLTCAALALALLVSGSATVSAGDKNTHEGKFVSVKDNKMKMEDKNGKEHSHDVATNAKISCDGKECKLSDLRSGTRIRVTTDDQNRATRIEAFTKSSDSNKRE